MHSEGQNSYRKELRRQQETQADYYKVLGVTPKADTTVIKKAYHELGEDCSCKMSARSVRLRKCTELNSSNSMHGQSKHRS